MNEECGSEGHDTDQNDNEQTYSQKTGTDYPYEQLQYETENSHDDDGSYNPTPVTKHSSTIYDSMSSSDMSLVQLNSLSGSLLLEVLPSQSCNESCWE